MSALESARIKRTRWILILFGSCTLLGLYNFSTFFAEHQMEGDGEPARKILLNEMTGAYSLFILLPPILAFMAQFPIRRGNWYWTLPLHLLAASSFGIVDTSIMTVSRAWLYPLVYLGNYQAGQLFFRYLMELHKQLLIYTIIAGVYYGGRRMRAARSREKEAAELALRASRLQTQLSEARLQVLQGQIQPHFLFNTMNMISSLMYEDVRKADRMMSRLCTLLRMSLDTSERPCVPLHEEMEILDVYLEIMEARFGQRLVVARKIDPELAEVPVPALLLQPLVENAIRHGEPEPKHPIEISVQAERRGYYIQLEVCDNGPGLLANGSTAEGLGLKSVRERLTQLYGENARLALENQFPKGLRVIIELPLPTSGLRCPSDGQTGAKPSAAEAAS